MRCSRGVTTDGLTPRPPDSTLSPPQYRHAPPVNAAKRWPAEPVASSAGEPGRPGAVDVAA